MSEPRAGRLSGCGCRPSTCRLTANTPLTTAHLPHKSHDLHRHRQPTAQQRRATLTQPVQRSGAAVEVLTILRPRTGDLYGLLLTDVLQMKVDAIATLLPRIATPTLTAQEVKALDTVDFVACAMEVAGFLTPPSKAQQAQDAQPA